MKFKIIKKADEVKKKDSRLYVIAPFISKEQLSLLVGWTVKTTNERICEFQEYITKGFYPKDSILRYSQSSYTVAVKPFLHFYSNYKNMKKGIDVPKYTADYLNDLWF